MNCKIIKHKRYFHIINENAIIKKTNNMKYLITHPNDIINNDDGKSHIRSYLQNLILCYSPKNTNYYDNGNPMSIATEASELHNQLTGTQSAIWCPLIYRALKYANHNIPNEWTMYRTSFIKFNSLSEQLSKVPFWNQYAAYILMYYTGPQYDNDFFADGLIEKSNEIRDVIYKKYNIN